MKNISTKQIVTAGLLLAITLGVFGYAQISSSESDTVSSNSPVVETELETNEAVQENSEVAEIAEGDRESAVLGANWGDNVEISVNGDTVSFSSDGVPNHEILDQYVADGRDGMYVSDAPVTSYAASFTFPLEPTILDSPADTPFGAIGVAVSGAVFFNPFEGDGSGTVANDDNTVIDGVPFIDSCGGHPLPQGTQYHYHGVPFCITDAQDTDGQHSEIIGFLLDGIPIYGPQDTDGNEPTDLDQCLGHTGAAPGYAGDVYHYHVTTTANYISDCLSGQATAARGPAR